MNEKQDGYRNRNKAKYLKNDLILESYRRLYQPEDLDVL